MRCFRCAGRKLLENPLSSVGFVIICPGGLRAVCTATRTRLNVKKQLGGICTYSKTRSYRKVGVDTSELNGVSLWFGHGESVSIQFLIFESYELLFEQMNRVFGVIIGLDLRSRCRMHSRGNPVHPAEVDVYAPF